MKKRILAAGENYLKEENSWNRKKISQQEKILRPVETGREGGWGAATLHPPTPIPDINAKIYLLPIDNYSNIVKGEKSRKQCKILQIP